MHNTKTIFFFTSFLILFSCAQLTAQNTSIKNAFDFYAKKGLRSDYNTLYFLSRSATIKNTLGNPYLNNWEDAFLLQKEGQALGVKARYSILDDELLIKLNDEAKVVYPHLIKGVIFKERTLVAVPYIREDGKQYGFFELLSEGKYNLLKGYELVTKQKKNAIKIIERKSSLFYQFSNSTVYPLPTNVNELMDFFIEKEQAVKTFIKSEALDMQSEKDMTRLFNYYNDLSKE